MVCDGEWGDVLCKGLWVVLVGCFNVGKSFLFNWFSCCEWVIVIDLLGIIRDLLESEIVLEGVLIILFDIVGICSIDDVVECLGIVCSEEVLVMVDVVLLVFDGYVGWIFEDVVLLVCIFE